LGRAGAPDPAAAGWLSLPRQGKFHASFAADLDADTADFMANSQMPWGVAALDDAVTDPPGVEPAMQPVPVGSFVRVDGRGAVHARSNEVDRSSFRLECHRQDPPATLAQGDHYLARPRLVPREPPVKAVLLLVLRPNMTTHMAAVDLDDPAGTSDPAPFISDAMASRILWARTKAVLYWTSRSRDNASALLPLTSLTKIARP
jgi:hypothetical protein